MENKVYIYRIYFSNKYVRKTTKSANNFFNGIKNVTYLMFLFSYIKYKLNTNI